VTAPEGGGVIITLADIYAQLIGLRERVDAALAKQDRTDLLVAEHDAELRPLAGAAERLTDHEARLRQLERSRWPIVLVGLGSLAATILIAIYGK
jgi:hypothetical protein